MKSEILILLLSSILNVVICSYCDDGVNGQLHVDVVADYSPPSSFKFDKPKYLAGSSLSLICLVESQNGHQESDLFYIWSSNCSRNCRGEARNTDSMHFPYLRSIDSGIYTCTVYNTSNSCSGSASIAVDVVGASIYVNSPEPYTLSNDDIITGNPSFIGVSSTLQLNEGILIDVRNRSVYGFSSLFYVRRDQRQAGILHVNTISKFRSSHKGIYTFQTRDKFGELLNVNVGIYPEASSTPAPSIICYEMFMVNSTATLKCRSFHTPPTEITWKRNGKAIDLDGQIYRSSKILEDRANSIYMNILHIQRPLDYAVGTFSCNVSNICGDSQSTVKNEGVKIEGPSDPVVVGLSAVFNCSTFLEAKVMKIVLRNSNSYETELASSRYEGQNILEYIFSPNSTSLDGSHIVCKVITNISLYEATFTLLIKELDHVLMTTPTNIYRVGSSVRIGCTAFCDIAPNLYWINPNGSLISTEGDSVIISDQFTRGNATTLFLQFDNLKASQGGTYSCISTIPSLDSDLVTTAEIVAELAVDFLSVIHSPQLTQLIGRNHTLLCQFNISDATDIPIQVYHFWTGPYDEQIFSDHRRVISEVAKYQGYFQSTLTINAVQPIDKGSFTCFASVQAAGSYKFVENSTLEKDSVSINPGFEVEIAISYFDPEKKYFPPEYRITSSVNYTCSVIGGENIEVEYQWNSTCSNCFAKNKYLSQIGRNILMPSDNGVHTCRVWSRWNGHLLVGQAQTRMIIRGFGIYLEAFGDQPKFQKKPYHSNNSYIALSTDKNFTVHICSSSGIPESITLPDLTIINSSQYANYHHRKGFNYSDFQSCFLMTKYHVNGTFQRGVHSFYFSNGMINIGIYEEDFNEPVSIKKLQRVLSRNHGSMEILCITGGAPPTYYKWYKDGFPLTANENGIRIKNSVIHRELSTYDLSLVVKGIANNIAGVYEIEIGNDAQNRSRIVAAIIKGIQFTCNNSDHVAGEILQCNCSSDLEPMQLQWYKNGSSLCVKTFSRKLFGQDYNLFVVSTNDFGTYYKCVSITPYGQQEQYFMIGNIKVPHLFGTISVTHQREITYGSKLTVSCTAQLLPGIFQSDVRIGFVQNASSFSLDPTLTEELPGKYCGNHYTQSTLSGFIKFDPVRNEDAGRYECFAEFYARVGGVLIHRYIRSYTIIEVISQAKFQLKILPVMHCSTLDITKAYELEMSIKQNIETAVRNKCNCSFNFSAIYMGQFVCPQTSCQISGCDSSFFGSNHIIYRATLNGTTNLLNANQILGYIDEWRNTSGTMVHGNIFRLRIDRECNIKIKSYDDVEC